MTRLAGQRLRKLTIWMARSLLSLSLLPLVSCDRTERAADVSPPPFLIEIELPGRNQWLNTGITAGPAGDAHVWFTAFYASSGEGVQRVSATEPQPTPYNTNAASNASITVGPDNNLWITQTYAALGTGGPHTITCLTKDGAPCGVYTIPYDPAIDVPDRWIWDITAANGKLYYTERYGYRIGCLDPDPSKRYFDTRIGKENFQSCGEWQVTTDSRLSDITQAADGNLYFTEDAPNEKMGNTTGGNKIGGFDPVKQTLIGEWPVAGGPTGLTLGPDNELWFTENTGDKIARFSLSEHTVTHEAPLAKGSQPWGITKGPPGDYAVWFTERGANKIARFSVAYLNIFHYPPAEFPLPLDTRDQSGNRQPVGITVGPDNLIWFTEENRSCLQGGVALTQCPSKVGHTTRAYQ